MKRISQLSIALIILFVTACTTNVDFKAEKEKVRSTIQQHLHANETEDVDLYNASTLGLRLVRSLAQDQLAATISIDRTAGTSVSIRFKRKTENGKAN